MLYYWIFAISLCIFLLYLRSHFLPKIIWIISWVIWRIIIVGSAIVEHWNIDGAIRIEFVRTTWPTRFNHWNPHWWNLDLILPMIFFHECTILLLNDMRIPKYLNEVNDSWHGNCKILEIVWSRWEFIIHTKTWHLRLFPYFPRNW